MEEDPVPRRMRQAAPEMGHVDGALGGSGRGLRLPAARQAEHGPLLAAKPQHRAIGFRLQQGSGGEPVGPHHHLVPVRCVAPVQNARRFKGDGVRPHRVMVVRHQGDGTAGQDRVENQPGRRVAKDAVIRPLPDQQRRIRSRFGKGDQLSGKQGRVGASVKLQIFKLGAADEQVHMAFDEAGQHRSATDVDDPCGRPRQPGCLDGGTDRDDAPVLDRHRFGVGMKRVHGQDRAIGDDQICGCHLLLPCNAGIGRQFGNLQLYVPLNAARMASMARNVSRVNEGMT